MEITMTVDHVTKIGITEKITSAIKIVTTIIALVTTTHQEGIADPAINFIPLATPSLSHGNM